MTSLTSFVPNKYLRAGTNSLQLSPEANEQLRIDREHNFSSRCGWKIVQLLFGQNILVREFDDHHVPRKLMTRVFKIQALAQYFDAMQPIIALALTEKMALDIAIRGTMDIISDEHQISANTGFFSAP